MHVEQRREVQATFHERELAIRGAATSPVKRESKWVSSPLISPLPKVGALENSPRSGPELEPAFEIASDRVRQRSLDFGAQFLGRGAVWRRSGRRDEQLENVEVDQRRAVTLLARRARQSEAAEETRRREEDLAALSCERKAVQLSVLLATEEGEYSLARLMTTKRSYVT